MLQIALHQYKGFFRNMQIRKRLVDKNSKMSNIRKMK